MNREGVPLLSGDDRDALAGARSPFDGLPNRTGVFDSTRGRRYEAVIFSSIANDLLADMRRRVRS